MVSYQSSLVSIKYFYHSLRVIFINERVYWPGLEPLMIPFKHAMQWAMRLITYSHKKSKTIEG